ARARSSLQAARLVSLACTLPGDLEVPIWYLKQEALSSVPIKNGKTAGYRSAFFAPAEPARDEGEGEQPEEDGEPKGRAADEEGDGARVSGVQTLRVEQRREGS